MTQVRLNHLMIINHEDLTDMMELEVIADEFIDAKESKQSIFKKRFEMTHLHIIIV